MKNIDSKTRIFTALSHKAPDRAPISYAASPSAHKALKKHLRIDDNAIPPDTPCANIMAFYDTCLAYKYK